MPPEAIDRPRRIMLTVNDRLAAALRTLGYDPDDEAASAGRGGGPCGAVQVTDALEGLARIVEAAAPLGIADPEQIWAALRRYATAIDDSQRRLARVFGRDEWGLMADVTDGCLDPYDDSETPLSIGVMLMANVQDGHRLDGAGAKWFGAEDADRKVEVLLRKIVKLTAIEQDAVAVAIRRFRAARGWRNRSA